MKKWLKITIGVVGGIVVLFAIGIYILINKGYGISVGRYLEVKDGTAMLVRGNSPIVLSSQHNGDMFYDLDIGDKILVIHTGIAESYPAQTGAKAIFKIGNGSSADIPQKVIKELNELGWIETQEMPISLEDVNIKIQEYFELDNVDKSNFKNSYVDREKEVVAVELIDNSKVKQDEFIYKVFSHSTGSKYIKYIKDNGMLEFRQAGVSGSASSYNE
ncbi:MAG: DUF3221 domain-containing protein [Firmicutes bacterium]|nr:DUF3221 domain-containing protein [Bacillota bacterium]